MPVHIRFQVLPEFMPVCKMRKWRNASACSTTGHAAVDMGVLTGSELSFWCLRSVTHVLPLCEPSRCQF